MSRDLSHLMTPQVPPGGHEAPPPPMYAPPFGEDEFDLGAFIDLVLDNKWLIVLFMLLGAALGGFFAFVKTPVYRVDATLQVEKDNKSLPGLSDISDMLESTTSSSTEIQLITSRSNLARVVDALNLQVKTSPLYFPVIGHAVARRFKGEGVANPPWTPWDGVNEWLVRYSALNPAHYAWGGERISVSRFDLEKSDQAEGWSVRYSGDGRFVVLDDNEREVLTGQVGKTASTNDPDYGRVSIFVSELVARPETRFRLSKLPRLDVVESLKGQLKVSEKGKKTGIIEIVMKSPDPARARSIVDLVANTYLRRNVEEKSQEAQQMLSFIEKQLPALKSNLAAAESVLEAHRKKHGVVDLNMEAQSIIESSADLEKQISLLELEKAELGHKFTDQHPRVIALKEKIARLKRKKGTLNHKLRAMPEAEWESAKLARDVKVANELYLTLLNKGQELKVAKAGTVGNVRIVDPAVAHSKPANNRAAALSLPLGLLLGLGAGIGLAMLRRTLSTGMIDPAEIEKKTGIPVYASILDSKVQRKIKLKKQTHRKGAKAGEEKILARLNPKDPAIEALRSLRTYLQFSQLDAINNVVVISGPSAGLGKSFVSVNLAAVLADSGKRVLLIDGDIRKGYSHCYFNSERTPGLADMIAGSASLKQVTRRLDKRLHFIPTGELPPNPSEVLMSSRFSKLLASAARNYDTVIVDTPPVLAVTDPLIIAKQAGAVFLTLKAGYHHEKEIKAAVKRFEQAGIGVSGFILNQLPHLKHHGYRYGAKGKAYYQYSYE